MHSQYTSRDGQLITEEDTFRWLWRGDLKQETESEIIQQITNKISCNKYITNRKRQQMQTISTI